MKLAEYLRTRGITQRQFANLIGATQDEVSRYANGERIPRPAVVAKIREHTNGTVTADDLYAAVAAKDGPPPSSGEAAA